MGIMMICMPDSLLLTVTSDDSVNVTSGQLMPATMKFPLELMTGDRGLSAEDSIGNLLSAGVRLSEVFCQSTLDCKVAMKRGQIVQRDHILPTSIAALRRGGNDVPLGLCMLKNGLHEPWQTNAFQG